MLIISIAIEVVAMLVELVKVVLLKGDDVINSTRLVELNNKL
jgi:hypothetical protein